MVSPHPRGDDHTYYLQRVDKPPTDTDTFDALTDTPTLAGNAGKLFRVNAG